MAAAKLSPSSPATSSYAPFGLAYSETSIISDLSALTDMAKPEPVTVQLAAAFFSCVFDHAGSGSTMPVDYTPEPHVTGTRFGRADFTCINDSYLAFMGLDDGIWCDIGRLIAASMEAKPKPPEHTADREAQQVVSVKVLGQQSSELLGMLRERPFCYGIVNSDDKPTDDAHAKMAALSEHQRT